MGLNELKTEEKQKNGAGGNLPLRESEEQTLPGKKDRNSNFEWLRIFAMIMIIFHHYCYHGGIRVAALAFPNRFLYNFFISYGKLGVVIFVMLSGYFGCKSKFNLKRLVLLFFEVVFYSVCWYVAECAIGDKVFGVGDFVRQFFVLYHSKYWFFTCYFSLYLISPLLNIIVKNLTQKQFFTVCVVGGFFYSFVASFSSGYLYRNNLISFMYLYLVAAYLRLYGGKRSIIFDLGGLFIAFLAAWIIKYVTRITSFEYVFDGFSIQSTTNLFIAAFLILLCKKSKPRSNKFVNYVAASTFGVYLIHDTEFRKVLWFRLFKNATYATKSFYVFALHMLITVAVVFIAGTIIDIVRREALERPLSILYDAAEKRLKAAPPKEKKVGA